MALPRKLTNKIYEIKAHEQKVTCLNLGQTGRVLVTGGQDRNVNLWACGDVECFQTLSGHSGQIDCVRFAYNDNFVYSADDNGIIKRWDLNSNQHNTLYGHMKSVRTFDFHPFNELVVSGSLDTTVRMWDSRKSTTCIDAFRGHIATVTAVRFSPDGSWIASAGSEGCLIIWDLRQHKKIIEFDDHPSPITCIEFHPFEFLIATGRADGTVRLYDLETEKCVSSTDSRSVFSGHTVRCVRFSENGECLLVGSAIGISVIGWEPDREFDHIESGWTMLGDMKMLPKNLYCASFEGDTVMIHDVLLDKVMPFYNPSNQPFSYTQSSRKSFNRGSAASAAASAAAAAAAAASASTLQNAPSAHSSPTSQTTAGVHRLQLSGKSPGSPSSRSQHNSPRTTSLQSRANALAAAATLANEQSAPNSLQFDMIEEEPPLVHVRNSYQFDAFAKRRNSSMFIGSPNSSASEEQPHHYAEPSPPVSMSTNEAYNDHHYNDYDYYPLRNGSMSERDDYPIQSATPPDYAPKIDIAMHKQQQQQLKHKSTALGRRHSPPGLSSHQSGSGNGVARGGLLTRKFNHSTVDLHAASSDESLPVVSRRSLAQPTTTSRNYISSYANNNNNSISVKSRNSASNTTTSHNRENAMRSKKINVQIYESAPKAPPTRSKTSLDLRSANGGVRASAPSSPNQKRKTLTYTNGSSAVSHMSHHQTAISHFGSSSNVVQRTPTASSTMSHHSDAEDTAVFAMLTVEHDAVIEQLSRRHATLMLLKNFAKTNDIVDALRHAIQIHDPSLLVDLFGIILETNAVAWSLDMCTLLLPELHELLRGMNRFHQRRACDTLRQILKKFLPIIQENSDPYGAPRSLGVDITAEERRKKCIECRTWLLHIKSLPANDAMLMDGSDASSLDRTGGLAEVQNLIVDL